MSSARNRRTSPGARLGRKELRNRGKEAGNAHLTFPIVGIGASAGGLEAFERLLTHLPDDLGMGYVLVQHLDPTHASHLTEILSRATHMSVTEVTDGMRVQPNHIYIIPPNTNMTLTQGALELVPRQHIHGQHMPIDFFFRSLADSQKHRAVGVILSGTASDGAAGMKAIKVAGGVTFAQDAKSAKYSGMPQSCISAGAVDFVLPPEAIADELEKIGRHPYFQHTKVEETEKVEPESEQDDEFREILGLMRKSFGVDFSLYKQSTIRRRIRRRMALQSVASVKDYLEFLKTHSGELDSLYQDMFISVSGFFREPDAFKRLKRLVFPSLLKNKPANSPVRIWVPGCSTGEEAYSVALSLLEFLGQKGRSLQVQVFATDISEDAIQKARRGRYLEDTRAHVEPKRLRRWFVKTDDGYQICKTVRDLIIFAKHDITKDPPFSRLDLISCRNLLIYLGPTLQKNLIPLFHYSLKPNGYLFLGAAETVGPFSNLFTSVDKKYKIYVKKPVLARPHFDYAAERYLPQPFELTDTYKPQQPPTSMEALKGASDLILLNEYAPPSVLVNEEMEILRFRGRTGPYLEPASGAATLSLLKMAREGLLPDLRAAFHEAQKKNIPTRREGVRVSQNGGWKVVNVYVAPVNAPLSKERHFLVIFKEDRGPSWPRAARVGTKRMTSQEQVSRERIGQLKQELAATKGYLESVIDKQETGNEELRSLNEEIMSSNEELQSTSEELETANEELQSANEELTTLNEELHNRNQELSRANNDILNILNSMNLTLIMLDSDLRIRRFTPAAQTAFNLIPSDLGRPISDIRHKLSFLNLEEAMHEMIGSGSPKQKEVQDHEGHWYSLQIRPYTTTEREIDGTVIALTDIHTLVMRNAELERAIRQLQRETADRQQAEQQLREVQRRLLEAAISRERDAMAREFHDTLSQILAGIVMQLEAADELILPDQQALRNHLVRAREVAREGLGHARRSAWAWRAGDRVKAGELPAALERLGHRLFDSTPIEFHLSAQTDRHPLPGPMATDLLRIAQEALANALRHSGATEVSVELSGGTEVGRLVVRDNGRGFDMAAARNGPGFGLLSMEERAGQMGGQLLLETKLGQGTKVQVVMPVPKQQPDSQ